LVVWGGGGLKCCICGGSCVGGIGVGISSGVKDGLGLGVMSGVAFDTGKRG
jgi:hypothetical protein